MDKKTFVCETVKAVLVELAKGEQYAGIFVCKEFDQAYCKPGEVIDNLMKNLCEQYDRHLESPKK